MGSVHGFSLSERLVQFQTARLGAEGVAWLQRLPAILEDCAQRWSLEVDPPFADLGINYAAPALQAGGAPVVLKVCFTDPEFFTEVEALRLFDGRGAARLLAFDLEQGALLLERLRPGTGLHTLVDDREATGIAAAVMRRLWRPAPPDHPFPTVARWVLAMRKRGPAVLARDRAFPARWVERALGLFADLTASPRPDMLLHGDLHHMNILAAEREPWLAIDPKGVVGEPVWETGPLLLNMLPPTLDPRETRRMLARRTEQLAGELGIDRRELIAWGVVRAVLAGFWNLEDEGRGWERDLMTAEILAGIDA